MFLRHLLRLRGALVVQHHLRAPAPEQPLPRPVVRHQVDQPEPPRAQPPPAQPVRAAEVGRPGHVPASEGEGGAAVQHERGGEGGIEGGVQLGGGDQLEGVVEGGGLEGGG